MLETNTNRNREGVSTMKKLISMKGVANYVAGLGADRPSKGTVSNWHNKGVHGVKLKVERYGIRVYSTRKDVDSFLAKTTNGRN